MPGPDARLSQDEQLFSKIAFSSAVREKLLSDDPAGVENIKLEDFSTSRHTERRGRFRQAIINFYEEAKAGDLVVLPEPIHMSRIWIGEFVSDEITDGLCVSKYGRTVIPARSIKWLGGYRENTVSSRLSEALRNQHPFTLLEKSVFLEVFSLAFNSFIYDGRHVATMFNGDDFLDSDSSLLGIISRISSNACYEIENTAGAFRESPDLLAILINPPPIEYTCVQESDIHSEGFTRYISGTVVPLVISATVATLIYLAFNSSKETLAEDIGRINYVNTGINSDPQCTAKISSATKRVLDNFGIDKTWAMCQAARESHRRAGIRPSAKIPVGHER